MVKEILFIALFLTIHLNAKFKDVSIGVVNINTTSNEYVYADGTYDRKISELIWKNTNANLFDIAVSDSITKSMFIDIKFQYLLNQSDSVMDDFDWLDDSNPTKWSDHSNHTNTKMTDFYILDLSFGEKFHMTKLFDTIISVGYMRSYKRFKAYGGTYTYSQRGTTNRNITGSFSGLGLTYSEEFNSFYVGLQIMKKLSIVDLSIDIKYSPFTYAQNSDTHHYRFFENVSKFESIKMLNIGFKPIIKFNKKSKLRLDISWTKYFKTLGNTKRTYYKDTAESTKYDWSKPYSGAGIENSYLTLGASFIVSF